MEFSTNIKDRWFFRLIFGLVVGLTFGLIFGLTYEPLAGLIAGPMMGLSGMAIFVPK